LQLRQREIYLSGANLETKSLECHTAECLMGGFRLVSFRLSLSFAHLRTRGIWFTLAGHFLRLFCGEEIVQVAQTHPQRHQYPVIREKFALADVLEWATKLPLCACL